MRGIIILILVILLEAKDTSWIVPKTRKMNGIFKNWETTQSKNVRRLRSAEKKGRLDYVLYGDSITSFHYGYTVTKRYPGSNRVWKKHFGRMNAVPLAIPGDQIGQVIWRLQNGREQPKEDPHVVGFLIGINDCLRFGEDRTRPRHVPTIDRMEYLLEWVRLNMPKSAVLLYGMTPTTNTKLLAKRPRLNASYKSLVKTFRKRGMRIYYINPGASISNDDGTPIGAGYLSDTLHLTPQGHDAVLRTMASAIRRITRKKKS